MGKKLVKSGSFLSMIIFILVMLCFNKCSTIYCPAFPEEYKVWFPYSLDQELFFTCNTDTVSLTVNEYYAPEEHSYSSNCDCDCETALYFYTSYDENFQCQLNGTIYSDEIDSINIPKISLTLGSRDYFYYNREGANAEYYDSLNIQGIIYKDVLDIKNTKGDAGYKFSEVKMVKNCGIVEFIDYENNIWNLVPKN